MESCYLCIVIDSVVPGYMQAGGEVAHAAARYGHMRYKRNFNCLTPTGSGTGTHRDRRRGEHGNSLLGTSRAMRRTGNRVTPDLEPPRGVQYKSLTRQYKSLTRQCTGATFGRSSTAILTHLLQRTVHSRSNEHCMHTCNPAAGPSVRPGCPRHVCVSVCVS